MKEREAGILRTVVREYIDSGVPVSSKFLYDNYDFGIKPASIRFVLNFLEDGGWLSQPYTSGGRIPTDKAYEFLVKNLKNDISLVPVRSKTFSELAQTFLAGEVEDFLEKLSDEIHTLSVSFSISEGRAFKSGFAKLFQGLDEETASIFQDIASDFETLDNHIFECAHGLQSVKRHGPEIVIGKKSPFMKNKHLTTVFDLLDVRGNEFLLIAIGPKRMDYEKNYKTFLGIRNALGQ